MIPQRGLEANESSGSMSFVQNIAHFNRRLSDDLVDWRASCQARWFGPHGGRMV